MLPILAKWFASGQLRYLKSIFIYNVHFQFISIGAKNPE